jgi:hypothetical protein
MSIGPFVSIEATLTLVISLAKKTKAGIAEQQFRLYFVL